MNRRSAPASDEIAFDEDVRRSLTTAPSSLRPRDRQDRLVISPERGDQESGFRSSRSDRKLIKLAPSCKDSPPVLADKTSPVSTSSKRRLIQKIAEQRSFKQEAGSLMLDKAPQAEWLLPLKGGDANLTASNDPIPRHSCSDDSHFTQDSLVVERRRRYKTGKAPGSSRRRHGDVETTVTSLLEAKTAELMKEQSDNDSDHQKERLASQKTRRSKKRSKSPRRSRTTKSKSVPRRLADSWVHSDDSKEEPTAKLAPLPRCWADMQSSDDSSPTKTKVKKKRSRSAHRRLPKSKSVPKKMSHSLSDDDSLTEIRDFIKDIKVQHEQTKDERKRKPNVTPSLQKPIPVHPGPEFVSQLHASLPNMSLYEGRLETVATSSDESVTALQSNPNYRLARGRALTVTPRRQQQRSSSPPQRSRTPEAPTSSSLSPAASSNASSILQNVLVALEQESDTDDDILPQDSESTSDVLSELVDDFSRLTPLGGNRQGDPLIGKRPIQLRPLPDDVYQSDLDDNNAAANDLLSPMDLLAILEDSNRQWTQQGDVTDAAVMTAAANKNDSTASLEDMADMLKSTHSSASESELVFNKPIHIWCDNRRGSMVSSICSNDAPDDVTSYVERHDPWNVVEGSNIEVSSN